MQVSYEKIYALIAKGIVTAEDISKKTGASTVCGGCHPRLIEFVGDDKWIYVKIIGIVEQNDHVRSYQLQPINRPISPYFAGQHIVIEAYIDNNWVARTYSLTSADADNNFYEITVKKEPLGLFSRWLFDHGKKDMVLRLTEPEGSFIFYPEKMKPAICFMGGIGITPAVAFARKLIANHMQRILHIDYSIAETKDIAFCDEISKWPQQSPNVTTFVRVTSEQGHIQKKDVADIITQYPNADYFICGPLSYEETLTTFLLDAGISRDRIHLELFTHAGGPSNSGNINLH